MQKNILVLASWFPNDDQDPTGRFIIEQANAIKDIRDSYDNNLFNVQIVDCRIRYPLIPKSWQNWLKAKQIAEVMKIENFTPDIIWAHVAFPAGVIGLELKKVWPNAKVILTEHCGPLSLLEKYFPSTESFNIHFLKYDKIIAVSNTLANEIKQRSKSENIHVIGNIVNDRFFHTPQERTANSNHMCFIGRCTYEKGFDTLIDSLIEYDKKYQQPIVIHILGNGPLLPNLLNTKFNFIRVENELSGDQSAVIKTLQKSSFLILPSRYETYSLVSAEAITLGKRVLGFKCGGPEDFINTNNGKLLDERNPTLLADEIHGFITKAFIFNHDTNNRFYFSKNYFQNKITSLFLY